MDMQDQSKSEMLRSSAGAISARLRRIKIRAIVPELSAMTRPWGLRLETREPGFFAVKSGRLCLRAGDESTVEVSSGEVGVVLRTHGAIVASDPPGTTPVEPPDLLHAAEMRARKGLRFGTGPATASFYCGGFMEIDGIVNDLFEHLPAIVVLPESRQTALAIEMFDSLSTYEHTREPQGDLIAGLLLMWAIETGMRAVGRSRPTLLQAMSDEAIGPVVQLIHDFPERDWSMERLALEAGLSRTMFHERFVSALGEAPMRFVRAVRLERARQLLESGGLDIREVSRRVGYGSASALTAALRRERGDLREGEKPRSGSATPGTRLGGYSGGGVNERARGL